MRFALLSIWIGLSLTLPGYADQPVGNMAQQMQLDQASQQRLQDIQAAPGGSEAGSRQRDRQQQLEQQALQERQRREVLMLNQRARIAPARGLPHRVQAIEQQQRFRRQQQNQLNRFSTQQGIR